MLSSSVGLSELPNSRKAKAMTPLPAPDKQYSFFFDEWGVTLNILEYQGRYYFILRQLCSILGITGVTRQAEVIKGRPDLAHMLTDLAVDTGRGVKLTHCLDFDGVGGWVHLISHMKVKEEAQAKLLKFQRDVTRLAKLVIYGVVQVTDSDEVSVHNDRRLDFTKKMSINNMRMFLIYLEKLLGVANQKINMLDSDDECTESTSVTLPAIGALPVGTCPHCGSPLILHFTENGAYLREA
jgi:hypothetical protein